MIQLFARTVSKSEHLYGLQKCKYLHFVSLQANTVLSLSLTLLLSLLVLSGNSGVVHWGGGQIITSDYRQIWRPDQPMSLIVSSIVGDVNEQDSIVNKCLWR